MEDGGIVVDSSKFVFKLTKEYSSSTPACYHAHAPLPLDERSGKINFFVKTMVKFPFPPQRVRISLQDNSFFLSFNDGKMML